MTDNTPNTDEMRLQKRIEEKNHCLYILRHLDVMCETARCTRIEAAIMLLSENVSELNETVYNIFEQMETMNRNLDAK